MCGSEGHIAYLSSRDICHYGGMEDDSWSAMPSGCGWLAWCDDFVKSPPGRFASFLDLSHRKILFQKNKKIRAEGAPSALTELPRRRGSSCVGPVTPKELLRFIICSEGAPSSTSITRELPRRNSSCVVTHACVPDSAINLADRNLGQTLKSHGL